MFVCDTGSEVMIAVPLLCLPGVSTSALISESKKRRQPTTKFSCADGIGEPFMHSECFEIHIHRVGHSVSMVSETPKLFSPSMGTIWLHGGPASSTQIKACVLWFDKHLVYTDLCGWRCTDLLS